MFLGGTPLLLARGQSFGGKTTSHVLWPCLRTCLVNVPTVPDHNELAKQCANSTCAKKKETKQKKQHENNMKIE